MALAPIRPRLAEKSSAELNKPLIHDGNPQFHPAMIYFFEVTVR
jgi:hypothetical protein